MTHKCSWIDAGIAVFFFVLGIGYWEYCRPVAVDLRPVSDDTPGIGISDREYIRLAKTTPEAAAFLKKYPAVRVDVDRSGALAVDFFMAPAGATHIDYIRLRVFVNPRTLQPKPGFIVCSGHLVEKHLLEFLETEQCLQAP